MRPAHEDPEYAPLAAVDRSAVLSPAGTSNLSSLTTYMFTPLASTRPVVLAWKSSWARKYYMYSVAAVLLCRTVLYSYLSTTEALLHYMYALPKVQLLCTCTRSAKCQVPRRG